MALLQLLVAARALTVATPTGCPSGATQVGPSAFFGCVFPSTGTLVRVGGTVGGKEVTVEASAASSIEGCVEIPGTLQLSAADSGRGSLSASRRLSCPPDATWHPNRRTTASVTDTWYVLPGADDGPAALGWNVTFMSADAALWTAPLASSVTVNKLGSHPKVWVGGPSFATAAVSNTSSPLDPLGFGMCDGARHGQCKYWYGGALTDLQFHQNLVTTNQQGHELVDAPSMALPIATMLGQSSGGSAVGLSFAQSARDHPVSMTLLTEQIGGTLPPPPPGQKCDSRPQPCPSHPGRTFCANVHKSGQCDAPPSPCPPCPPPPPPPHAHCVAPAKPCHSHPDRCCKADSPTRSAVESAASSDATGGSFRFSRQYHRLGGGAAAVSFSQALLLHEDCFRPALRWYDAAYPDVLRVDSNIDRSLVDGHATSVNFRGDKISAEAKAASIATGVQVWNVRGHRHPPFQLSSPLLRTAIDARVPLTLTVAGWVCLPSGSLGVSAFPWHVGPVRRDSTGAGGGQHHAVGDLHAGQVFVQLRRPSTDATVGR